MGRRSKAFTDAVALLPDVCDACKAAGLSMQIDRRLPRVLGGRYVIENVHKLCLDCHKRKTTLEVTLRIDAEWLDIAYPRPTPRAALDYLNRTLEAVEEPQEERRTA